MKVKYYLLFIGCFFLNSTLFSQIALQDSLALISIYNKTNGSEWTNSWNLSTPVNTWYGVSLTGSGVKVTRINLNNNNLQGYIPDSINLLTGLDKLFLRFNKIDSIQSLNNLINLTALSVNGNNLTELPNLEGLNKLSVLEATNNNLITVDNTLDGIDLNALRLGGNNLSELPDISHMTSLTELSCQYNQLTGLPNLDNLTQLTALDCSFNCIDSLPNMSNLTTLNSFKAHFNKLTTIPDISNLSNLTQFFVYENNLPINELEKLALSPSYSACVGGNNNCFKIAYQTLDSIPILGNGRTYIDSTLTISVNEIVGDSLYYQWFKDGAPVSELSRDTFLTIDTIVVQDRGLYTCKATSSIFPFVLQDSYDFEVAVYGVDSLGGVYYPNQYVVQFANAIYDYDTKQELREEFKATVLDSCMCGQQLELWEIPDTISLSIDGEVQNVHDDNTKKKSAKRKSKLDGCDFNYIVRTDGLQQKQSSFEDYNNFSKKENEGIKIAILDSGIDAFDPTSNLLDYKWQNPDELGNDDDDNCYENDLHGIHIKERNFLPNDDHYNLHGSNIAQLISIGLDPNDIELISIKTHDSEGWGSLFEGVCATYYAKEKGAKLINASWSYRGEPSTILYNALKLDTINQTGAERNDDFLFITSAGNSNKELVDTLFYPAGYEHDHILAVMSVDNEDNIPIFSNYGVEHIDLAARGVNIPSYYEDINNLNGTSMSTAYVTGFAARLLVLYPDLDNQSLKDSIFARLQYPPSLEGKCSTNGRLPEYLYESFQSLIYGVEAKTDRVILNWETTFEVDMLGYDIEGSSNGIDFTKLGYVTATNQSQNKYQFIDWCPHETGDRFYRLKMIAQDDEKYSEQKKVSIQENNSLVTILGNVIDKELTIVFRGSFAEGIIELYDSIGKLYWNQKISGEKGSLQKINLESLSKGIYLGRIIVEDEEQVFKIQKQ